MRSVRCPHCGSASRIRWSRQLSDIVKEIRCACTNIHCGHTFVAHVEVTHTLSPSACPNPAIAQQLKQSEMGKRLYGEAPALGGPPQAAPVASSSALTPVSSPADKARL